MDTIVILVTIASVFALAVAVIHAIRIVSWRCDYAMYMLKRGATKEQAAMCADAAEYTPDVDPEDAAEDEISYWAQEGA